MTETTRVILEIGKKRRVVAGAMDWPGLDRWGTSEDDALDKLAAYRPRYAGVAERAGLADEFARADGLEVVERVPGSSSTDFWGIAHVPSQIERDVLSPADLERRLDLLQACWAYFDDVAARVSAELLPGPRSAGRSRDQIIRHVDVQRARAVLAQGRGPDAARSRPHPGRPQGPPAAYLAAIRAYNAEGKPARSWPIQFLIRRTAHHVMDHAWEMEDRDLGPATPA